MKKYEEPNMEVIFFDEVRIVTTSSTVLDPNEGVVGGSDSTDWSDIAGWGN